VKFIVMEARDRKVIESSP